MAAQTVSAQEGFNIPPRREDYFQSNMMVYRISLDEKINTPLVDSYPASMYSKGEGTQTQGVVAALLEGLKSGKYLAHDPDDLSKTLTYDDVKAMAAKWNSVPDDELIDTEWEEEDDVNMKGLDEEYVDDEEDIFGTQVASDEDFSVAPFESVIEIIENKIFDDNRSAEVHDIQYIRLVWVDPAETLPDHNFICISYDDAVATLEDTQWRNKYNDAEDRNMREIFELRLFNGVLASVSGRGVRTLEEAEFRRQQNVEFEHNLWSY
jgi:hypothetical protein